MPWTSETTDTLKALWADGLSASEIATAIGGVTRNAVIGKVHRLGLGGRRKRPAFPRPTRVCANVSDPPNRPRIANGRPGRPRIRGDASRAPKKQRWSNGRDSPIASLPQVAVYGAQQPILDLPPLGEPPATPVTILSLKRGLCRWPEGDPKDPTFHFCGRAADGVYCKHHEGRAYLRAGAED